MGLIKKIIGKVYSPKYLLTTNTLTMCGIYGSADAIVQLFSNEKFDFGRVLRVSSIGFLHGPMNHYWYKWLDKKLVIVTTTAGISLTRILVKKVAIDLSVSPIFAVTFIGGVALLEGHSIKMALKEYKDNFFKILKLDLCVWPPAQSLNFWFVPPSFRVLYVSVVILIYTCFLTFIRHSNNGITKKLSKASHDSKPEFDRIL